MPPVALLSHYLDEDSRRGFVDSMAEVKVKQEEVIMRQGARATTCLPAHTHTAAPRAHN